MGTKIDSVMHTYIVYLISRRGLSQAFLADMCGVSPVFMNYIIKGTRTSKEVQEKLAVMLGFRSWNSLVCAAYEFQERAVAPGFQIKEVSNA